jgi:hypothetical protein
MLTVMRSAALLALIWVQSACSCEHDSTGGGGDASTTDANDGAFSDASGLEGCAWTTFQYLSGPGRDYLLDMEAYGHTFTPGTDTGTLFNAQGEIALRHIVVVLEESSLQIEEKFSRLEEYVSKGGIAFIAGYPGSTISRVAGCQEPGTFGPSHIGVSREVDHPIFQGPQQVSYSFGLGSNDHVACPLMSDAVQLARVGDLVQSTSKIVVREDVLPKHGRVMFWNGSATIEWSYTNIDGARGWLRNILAYLCRP